MLNNAYSTCRKIGTNSRRPALLAIIEQYGTILARIEPPKTLNDSYTRFFAKCPISFELKESDTQIHTIQNYVTEGYPVLIQCCIVYAILLIAEVQPTLLHC